LFAEQMVCFTVNSVASPKGSRLGSLFNLSVARSSSGQSWPKDNSNRYRKLILLDWGGQHAPGTTMEPVQRSAIKPHRPQEAKIG
jgi:hypothetical protein